MKAMDFSFKNNTRPIKGALLLSDPFEADVHFTRSVVLICNHDESGTFGFVLNNYVHLPAEELNEALTSYKGRVSIGGPVDKTNLYYIHRFGNVVDDSEHIVDDLYFGGNFAQLIEQIKTHPLDETRVRFFIGYSGWGEGQLEEELERNSWIVVNNIETSQLMNTSNNQFWKDIMTRQGMKFKLLADFPMNPENN